MKYNKYNLVFSTTERWVLRITFADGTVGRFVYERLQDALEDIEADYR